ncbi:hypothetical protein M422DRAFT_782158 [Sphaerobolus stellatus SS14]|uniref:Unplaced genomic scaffold SPHSTscaffold_101, whole genome shotgun sequence n=1 Tax=Sphaerobolus stellatus (strain SS14) TaxID=990650 RepID=A0A0C9UET2_SPHS4|nr:hypothetical protein M422DRAFT_784859 [Sphaerobolus stellatus SS14]KIJ36628.1 hypothetical protein M422DRAFT_782158 [Sphaerobolus stellatus SS14]
MAAEFALSNETQYDDVPPFIQSSDNQVMKFILAFAATLLVALQLTHAVPVSPDSASIVCVTSPCPGDGTKSL